MEVKATTSDENSFYPRERSHVFFLCKFFEKEKHAADFMAGKLYANKLSYFQSLEEQERAKRGDKHEGIIAWGQPGIVRIEIDGHDISNDLAGPASLSSNRLSEFNVVCMHAGHIRKADSRNLEDLSQIRKQLLIPTECKKFGKFAVVIKNGLEFLNRVKIAAQLKGYRETHGLVKYYDPDTFSGFFPGISGAFMKQEQFRLEREYRIVFETGSIGSDAIVLDIGNLADIAMRSTIDEINRNMKVVPGTKTDSGC